MYLSDDQDIFDLDMDVTVICDLRTLGSEDFWLRMEQLNYVFLQTRESPFVLPNAASVTSLPTTWSLS
eukprot:g2263.t1